MRGMISPKNQKRLPYIVVVTILFVGAGLSIVAYNAIQKWEVQKSRMEFYRAAENRYESLQREIRSNLHAVESLQAFYLHSEKITRSEFRDFTKTFLLYEPGMQALGWIPRVPYFQREEYEAAAKKEGYPDFRITDEDAEGNIIRAKKRKEYFPVYFAEPHEHNEFALGFNMASSPAGKESLEKSRDKGEIVATTRGTLGYETPGQHGFADCFLIIAPIFTKNVPAGSVQSRRESLRGFVLGLSHIGELVEGALAYLESEGVDLYIYDQSSPKGRSLLYFSQSPLHKTKVLQMSYEEIDSFKDIKYINTLDVAGQEWLMAAIPIPEFMMARKTRLPQGVLCAGFLLTGLLVSYLWSNIKHSEALRESERKYKSLIETTVDGIYKSDADSTFRFINQAGAEMFGHKSPAEIIGKSVFEYWADPKERASFLGKLKRAKGLKAYPLRGKKKDGSVINLEMSSHILEDGKGCFMGVEGILRDVTEKVDLEAQLRQAQKMEAVGQLAGGVAHDFNNILSAIIGYGNLTLMKMAKDDPQLLNIQKILDAADRAAHLTKDLLLFSRKQISDRRPMDLNMIIRTVENFLVRVIGEDIAFKALLHDGLIPILADAYQFEQVLMNLAINARDAMPKGGILTVATEQVRSCDKITFTL